MAATTKLLLAVLAIVAGAQCVGTSMIMSTSPPPVRPAAAVAAPKEASEPATPPPTPASTPTATPTPTPVPTPTPTPIATSAPAPAAPSQDDLTVVYVGMTERDAHTAADALRSMASACQSGDLQPCRRGMVDARNAVQAYQSDLDRTAAPTCLSSADGEIRQALGNLRDGLDLGISGVDNLDAGRVDQGVSLIMQGNDHLTSASALIKSASC
jgi:hypothetical protein